MTQEEKDLVIKDLCGRLPYGGVKIHISYADGFKYDKTLTYEDVKNYSQLPADSTTMVKLYLRPMSSMTEEEEKQFQDVNMYELPYTVEGLDWLNAHHFDYRGLIEKGLAEVAPEGMYNE